MSPMGEQTLEPVETPQPKTHRKPVKRLTAADVGTLIRYREEGLTQTAIAQRLGCNQAAVCRWLQDLTDTTDLSKSYLRGQSLRMAQNIVKRGKAADHVKALQGLSVLSTDEHAGGITVIVGSGSQVQINLGGPVNSLTPQPVVVDTSLTKSE